MSFLDVHSDSKRASHARLVLDLDELAECDQEWVPLGAYAAIRRIDTHAAARRSLFRVKRALAQEGITLEVNTRKSTVSARFGTQPIRDLVALHLRSARALVEKLEARREGRAPDLEGLARESELVTPEAITSEFHDRGKSQSWIARRHGIGVSRVRRILAATGPTTRAEGRRLEGALPESVVARALAAADRLAPLDEIAAILGCSKRTASRFVARHGRVVLRGRRFVARVVQQMSWSVVSPLLRA